VTSHRTDATVYAVSLKSYIDTLAVRAVDIKSHTSDVIALIMVVITREVDIIADTKTEIAHMNYFKPTT